MASEKQKQGSPELDDELNDLLDDALLDFEAAPKSTPKRNDSAASAEAWSRDFAEDDLSRRMAELKDSLGSGSPSASRSFGQITPPNSFVDPSAFKAAFETRKKEFASDFTQEGAEDDLRRRLKGQTETLSTPPNSFVDPSAFKTAFESQLKDSGLDAPLSEALKMMSADSEALRNPPNPDELERMFKEMRVLGERADAASEVNESTLLPIMETMMQSLLSKDLLYPAISELKDKYPDWLADNREKLSKEDFEKFNKQFELTKQICHEFDRDLDKAPEAEKKQSFERIMELMQSMQMLGNPPSDLVGESNKGPLDFDAQGNPFMKDPEQCKMS